MKFIRAILLIFLISIPKTSWAKETVILLGDSLAVGLAEHFKKGAHKKGYNAVTLVKIGDHLHGWSRRVNSLRLYKPSYVVICLGTNDAVSKYSPVLNDPDIISKFDSKIRSMGAIPIWIGPPIMPTKKVPFLNKVRKNIQERTKYYFDSTLLEDNRLPDGIHYTYRGYQLWMDEIWSWALIQELL
jgi:lysophospholipase L1-like esterase